MGNTTHHTSIQAISIWHGFTMGSLKQLRDSHTSVPKERCVMAMSSTMMLNSLALAVRLSRTCGNMPVSLGSW